MLIVSGTIQNGVRHFTNRMQNFPDVFQRATGENLYPGTLNVNVGSPIIVNEHFRIKGSDINDPQQDLLFEICKINGIWAYRIRPFNLLTGSGGHGDHIIEIACSQKLNNVNSGDEVNLTFFR